MDKKLTYKNAIVEFIGLIEMKPLNRKSLCILFLIIPFTFQSTNETDLNSFKSKSNHPYSSLWFYGNISGIIGFFLNSLGKHTINC